MLRVTQFIRDSIDGKPYRAFPGLILIWNVTNLCNLSCDHCYASANHKKTDELSEEEALALIPQLKEAGVKFVVLSGGEPLARKDTLNIARAIKEMGLRTSLSSNGLLINATNVEALKPAFDYVGISIDGKPETHDLFRGKKGAFDGSMAAIKQCIAADIKVGIRITLTKQTFQDLPFVFELAEKENIPKIFISHLVYSGRGENLEDLNPEQYRQVVDWIVDRAFSYVENQQNIEIVTGNNDADAVILAREFSKRHPNKINNLMERLKVWGGNQAGVKLLNIDYKGNVKPDPFFLESVGNVRDTPFATIWSSNGLLTQLRQHPRKLTGKCSNCDHIKICNGSSRPRAYAVSGNYFAEDPACYI